MSDKIVNVYVGECFQEGGQAGGEGKTYGLSLSGNKWQFLKDSPSTSNLFTKKVNILYDATLVNKDGSIDNLDLSKLPQDIRAFNLTVTPV